MKKIWTILLFILILTITNTLHAKLTPISLEGKSGGRIDGTKWSSSEIKDKVYVLFYVDPDKKDLNEHVANALKNKKFDTKHYGTIVIINMAATWLPNFAITSSLKEKQAKYPEAIYIKDLNKTVVKKWNLKDDDSNILLFNKKGELIFNESGKLSQEKISTLLNLIETNMGHSS